MALLALLLVLALLTFMPPQKTVSAQTPGTLEIDGDVNMPMTLTSAELSSLPMVSEVAELRCVTGSPDVVYNWTGIPLFYLLTLAEIKPDAYKVVTQCSDGYSSDLLVQDALAPTTILALEANETSLPQLTYGPEGPYRLVVPGKFGYKWSSGIEEIKVVTTDYKGEWEGAGYSDVADVPNYGAMPTPTPPVQTLNVTYGNRTFEVGAFTDASITVSSFDPSLKALNMNVSVPLGTLGFTDLILQQDFLSRPYNVTLDGTAVSPIEADTNTSSYIYLALEEGFHTMSISAAEFDGIPEAIVYYPASINVGQNATFDASKSVDVGKIVSYEWSFGDGTNGTGPIVEHSYDKGGTYQVTVNVTNEEGGSDLKTFAITVGSPGLDILLLSKVLLVAMLVALILIFAFLLRKRRTTNPPSSADSPDALRKEDAVVSCASNWELACWSLPVLRGELAPAN
jgi:PKD repeat protein